MLLMNDLMERFGPFQADTFFEFTHVLRPDCPVDACLAAGCSSVAKPPVSPGVCGVYLSLDAVGDGAKCFYRCTGTELFSSIAWLNLLFITCAGAGYFSTAITEEKEEETLGLLQMAGLNHIGILLGKSTSRLIQVMLLLVVQFPFMLLAVTLGGVTTDQILAAYVSVLAFTVLLANLGAGLFRHLSAWGKCVRLYCDDAGDLCRAARVIDVGAERTGNCGLGEIHLVEKPDPDVTRMDAGIVCFLSDAVGDADGI